jgi:hypothetical protein
MPESSSALSDIDSRLEAAKLAQQQAEAEHRQFEKEYHNFRSIPAKHEQLTGKVANLEAERTQLDATDFNAKIRQLIEIELNPKRRDDYRQKWLASTPRPTVPTIQIGTIQIISSVLSLASATSSFSFVT